MGYYKFSVSMCVYKGDNPVHFKEAVDSILNQTVLPAEVVLVEDGPVTEELEAIIKEYEKSPIFKVIRSAENRGHGEARRISMEHCTCDLIALMDADDISMINRFEKQIACFEQMPELSVVGGHISEFMGEQENVIGRREVPQEDKEIKQYLKIRCPMNQVTVMFRKNDVEEVGGYLDWFCEEDYYLWARLFLADKKFYNVQEVLVNVRVGAEMYQRRGGWKYFKSEAEFQKYLLSNKIIGVPQYIYNVLVRLFIQLLMPNWLRGFVYRKLARQKGE